jgi:hypothetical protein
MTMKTDQMRFVSKHHMLSDDDIQTRARPAPERELQAVTAIRAGYLTGCYTDSEAQSKACCDAKPNTESRQIHLGSDGQWFCMYSDSGTGDWD